MNLIFFKDNDGKFLGNLDINLLRYLEEIQELKHVSNFNIFF